MNFHFTFINHPGSVALVADIVRPLMYGLEDAGHRVRADAGAMESDSVAVFLECFQSLPMIYPILQVKDAGMKCGLVLTEDPDEMQGAADRERWTGLRAAIPLFDFFWCFDRPEKWHQWIPAEKIAPVQIGSYINHGGQNRFGITQKTQFVDFLIYGSNTPYRAKWEDAIRASGKSVMYSVAIVRGGYVPQPDYVLSSLLGSVRVMLDIPRHNDVVLPSHSRLSLALQSGIPVVSDRQFNFSGTIYEGYVERVSPMEFFDKIDDYLSPEFAIRARKSAQEWRRKYPAAGLLREAVALVGKEK